MPGEPILIVDGHPANLKLVRLLLETEGYDVRVAKEAGEALRVLEEFRPRLILMDLQLTGMDGLALTQHLKTQSAMRDTLILAVTAHATIGDEEKVLAAGCDGNLSKPIDIHALPQRIARLLARGGERMASAAPATRESGPVR